MGYRSLLKLFALLSATPMAVAADDHTTPTRGSHHYADNNGVKIHHVKLQRPVGRHDSWLPDYWYSWRHK